jgi:isochorismate hydrolase
MKELRRLVPESGWRGASPIPECSALLVIDMQEYFRAMAAPILPGLKKVILAARRRGVPVIYTQHGHGDPQKDGGMLGAWWGELILAGSDAAEILVEIAPESSDRILAKKRYSAFHGTDLEKELREKGIEDVIISGVMTNLCAETTARDAFVRDFRVFFLADGTATASEEYQVASLRNLAYGFAYLLTCEAAVRALNGSTGGTAGNA